MGKKIIKYIFELTAVIFVAVAIFLPLRYFVIQPFYVKGVSMEPNLLDREYLLVDKVSYYFSSPRRGDMVVFRYPLNPDERFIKRVIGLPGETVQIKDGRVYLYDSNGNSEKIIIDEPYLSGIIETYSLTPMPIRLGSDEFFVLGDNREFSKDSRVFGPIDRHHIIGRVLLRGWPLSRITLFENPLFGRKKSTISQFQYIRFYIYLV